MMPFERRTRACQGRLTDMDADVTVLFPSRNLLYLSGFDEELAERHLLLFVPREGAPAFLILDLYETQVRAESWVADVRTWSDDDDPRNTLADTISDLGLAGGRVPVDNTMWAHLSQDLWAALPDADSNLTSEVVAPLCARGDDAELDALRRTGATVDRAVERVRDMGADAVSMTESELTAEVERLLADEGGEGILFGPLVRSDPNGTMPHHSHGDHVIESGDLVVLDFGTVVDHYPGDQTRIVVFADELPVEFVEVHGVVQAARTVAVETVEPGATAGDVDRVAREIIEKANYGDRFIHRTSHSIGLDMHGEPYIVAGSDRELEVGNVFSVEPGVYLPDESGVRIEDLIVVTDDGAESLNDTDRGWRC